MGALHEGHASLIRAARADAESRAEAPPRTAESCSPDARTRDRVVVTIFVNPTQFGPREDFTRYPRTLEADLELSRAAGADAVFVPSVETIYPRGLGAARTEAAAWDLPPTAVEPQLEDRCRPGHFGGVCLVVSRLFELCRPSRAFFGEKDWQQLRVITQMVERERMRSPSARRFDDLEIVPCPIVREPDGLAMSSRNRYLSDEERQRATALWRAIEFAQAAWKKLTAESDQSAAIPIARGAASSIEGFLTTPLMKEGFEVDYAVVRDALTLRHHAAPAVGKSLRILIAARLPSARLIDNAPLEL